MLREFWANITNQKNSIIPYNKKLIKINELLYRDKSEVIRSALQFVPDQISG